MLIRILINICVHMRNNKARRTDRAPPTRLYIKDTQLSGIFLCTFLLKISFGLGSFFINIILSIKMILNQAKKKKTPSNISL